MTAKVLQAHEGSGEINVGKQKKMKGKQVIESCSRIFHGLYWPVSPLGNKHCPLLRKECFEIPKLNRFKKKAGKEKKSKREFKEGN